MISFRKSLLEKLHYETIRFYSVTIVNKSKSFWWGRHVTGVAIQECLFYRQKVKKIVLLSTHVFAQ
jgi:hypothetical protein